MSLNRRNLFAAFAASAGAVGAATPARADAVMPAEIDAVTLGLRPNAPEDQTTALQRAIERAAAARAVLRLPPGDYRAGSLQLPPYAALAGNQALPSRLHSASQRRHHAKTSDDHASHS